MQIYNKEGEAMQAIVSLPFSILSEAVYNKS